MELGNQPSSLFGIIENIHNFPSDSTAFFQNIKIEGIFPFF